MLQRGRARAGAEWNSGSVSINWREVLQRGRARAGAECAELVPIVIVGEELQRGRARAGAECALPLSVSGRRGGRFNGAAPARARNVGRGTTARRMITELQRGRARAGAEC